MLNFRPLRRAARILSRGGFTLVELLVVIGIIAILAGVALGPITNGIKKAKQSGGMQTAHVIGLSMYSYANDNSQIYPDSSGTGAGGVAQALLAGGYVSDPSIFYISGGAASKWTGTTAAAATGIGATNVSFDFAGSGTGVTGSGWSSVNYSFMPIMWSTTVGTGSTPVNVTGGNVANTAITAVPAATTPFQTAGLAVFYINNSAKFVNGANGTVTLVPAASNGGGGPASAVVLSGGG
jgi:prepilin-type N-terminal cleavage/methylation domain-containing protein